MEKDIEKIKAKIKKLIALSRSPNPHEAASALKMAQDLMAEYNIEQSDVGSIEIGEETTSTVYRHNPTRYECILFGEISKAFGCEVIHHIKGKKCVWRFIGLCHRAQIAAYIGQVLLRKLKSARAVYCKSLYRVRSKYRKTKRADDFCLAWVNTVTDKLSEFAGISREEQNAITLYVEKNHPDLKKITAINRSLGNAMDYLNGTKAGEGVQLQHGVGVHSPSFLLLGASYAKPGY